MKTNYTLPPAQGKPRDDFAIFILTHGRPDNVLTWDTLQKVNYTGKVYLIVDNEDKTIDEYKKRFGEDKVIVFDKLAKSKEFDTCDCSDRDRRAIVYARNVCFDVAKKLGLKYFLELDDDYTAFRQRYDLNGTLSSLYVQQMNLIIDEMIDFLETSGALTVAFAQTGDLIGGMTSRVYKERCTRKAMNSFFCKTDRKFDFIGRINEDVNTYTWRGSRGELLFTIADISLDQQDSQQNKGGMTELYLNAGTYVKSFYSVIVSPSCVKIAEMGCGHRRMHHLVDWEHCTPKIISDRFRK